MTTGLNTYEIEGRQFVRCAYCSKSYQAAGIPMIEGVRPHVPATCDRCGAPMDVEGSRAYADRMAEATHDPTLTAMGNRMRGMQAPQRDKQVKAATSKGLADADNTER